MLKNTSTAITADMIDPLILINKHAREHLFPECFAGRPKWFRDKGRQGRPASHPGGPSEECTFENKLGRGCNRQKQEWPCTQRCRKPKTIGPGRD
jgi:hypothetical protein